MLAGRRARTEISSPLKYQSGGVESGVAHSPDTPAIIDWLLHRSRKNRRNHKQVGVEVCVKSWQIHDVK